MQTLCYGPFRGVRRTSAPHSSPFSLLTVCTLFSHPASCFPHGRHRDAATRRHTLPLRPHSPQWFRQQTLQKSFILFADTYMPVCIHYALSPETKPTMQDGGKNVKRMMGTDERQHYCLHIYPFTMLSVGSGPRLAVCACDVFCACLPQTIASRS